MKAGRPARSLRRAALGVTLLAAGAAWARGGPGASSASGWTLLGPLLLAGLLYARGTWVLWRGRDLVHGLKRWQAACFGAGWLTVLLALSSPLARASEARLSAHVGQHALLTLVAAPLVVLGRPLISFLWAFPPAARRRLVATTRRPAVLRAWRLLTHPLFIVLAYALALWGWHAPVLLEAALRSGPLHALQRASGFFTAALFFRALVLGRSAHLGPGAAVASVLVTALHSALLGGLFTLSQRPWYPHFVERSAAPLEDQHLAGLLLGGSPGVLLTGLALARLVAWLGPAGRAAKPSSVERLPTRREPASKTGP